MRRRLVTQKLPADCGICCIAMATGLPWRTVLYAAPIETVEDLFCGLTIQQIVTTMRRLGQPTKFHWPEKYSPNNIGIPLREQMRGKNAIHLVPSINVEEEGCYHYVLFSNGRIYDPSPPEKLRYRSYEQLEPLGVVYQPSN